MARRNHPSKYRRVAAYLAALPVETETETLTFPAIAALLGGSLPPSAWHRLFWQNGSHVARVGWRPAGWLVYAVDLTPGEEAVSFVRVGPPLD